MMCTTVSSGSSYTGVHRVRIPPADESVALLQGLPMGVNSSTAGFAVLDVDGLAPAVAAGCRHPPAR